MIPIDPSTGNVDVIECDSPIELVQAIVGKEKNKGMSMDKLGQEIFKQTGLSWNKRFKGKYGTMIKVSVVKMYNCLLFHLFILHLFILSFIHTFIYSYFHFPGI